MDAYLRPDVDLSDEDQQWLGAFLSSTAPGILRARAALALSAHGKMNQDEVARLVDVLPVAAWPDIAAALALASAGSRTAVRAVTDDDLLMNWVYEVVSENREGALPSL